MITNNYFNIMQNSSKALSYHFDFYVGEKYRKCLLVDFSLLLYWWSIAQGNQINSHDQ